MAGSVCEKHQRFVQEGEKCLFCEPAVPEKRPANVISPDAMDFFYKCYRETRPGPNNDAAPILVRAFEGIFCEPPTPESNRAAADRAVELLAYCGIPVVTKARLPTFIAEFRNDKNEVVGSIVNIGKDEPQK